MVVEIVGADDWLPASGIIEPHLHLEAVGWRSRWLSVYPHSEALAVPQRSDILLAILNVGHCFIAVASCSS